MGEEGSVFISTRTPLICPREAHGLILSAAVYYVEQKHQHEDPCQAAKWVKPVHRASPKWDKADSLLLLRTSAACPNRENSQEVFLFKRFPSAVTSAKCQKKQTSKANSREGGEFPQHAAYAQTWTRAGELGVLPQKHQKRLRRFKPSHTTTPGSS